MWYKGNGVPTIPLSGVMGLDELREMTARLAKFIEPK